MTNALVFILKTALSLYSLAFLLRFYLQVTRATASNPLNNFVQSLTNFFVLPARKFIPGFHGYDLSGLVLCWISEVLLVGLVLSVSTIDLKVITGNIFIGVMCLALINVLKMLIYIVLVSTFALAVLSWINPFSPVMSLLHGMTAPFMNVFRKRIPPIGGIDLSALFVLVACQVLLMWPIESMYRLVALLMRG